MDAMIHFDLGREHIDDLRAEARGERFSRSMHAAAPARRIGLRATAGAAMISIGKRLCGQDASAARSRTERTRVF